MAERLDSVPESYCSDDDLQDDFDYYYNDGSDGEAERGEEELNELAANADPEYYQFKCLRKRGDVVGYLDALAEKFVASLDSKSAVSAAGSRRRSGFGSTATAAADCAGFAVCLRPACGLFMQQKSVSLYGVCACVRARVYLCQDVCTVHRLI